MRICHSQPKGKHSHRPQLLQKLTPSTLLKAHSPSTLQFEVTPGDAYLTTFNWKPKAYLRTEITLTRAVHWSSPYDLFMGSCPDLRDCAIKCLRGNGDPLAKKVRSALIFDTET